MMDLPAVFISLGNDADIGITDEGQLILQKTYRGTPIQTFGLGRATEDRINQLQEYLGRLKCHAVSKETVL